MRELLNNILEGKITMLYICYQNIMESSFIGVRKKIMAQCRVFEKNLEGYFIRFMQGK